MKRLFCCGWRSPTCVLDNTLHVIGRRWRWACDRHELAIWRSVSSADLHDLDDVAREFGIVLESKPKEETS